MRQEARELDANSEWISECAECVKYGERDGKGVKKGVMRVCNCLQNMGFERHRLPKVLFSSAA